MGLNIVHGVGCIYWIVRDTATAETPRMSTGWVHELGGYWRKGKGIQFKTGKYITQVGVCKRHKVKNEEDGILEAMQGRMLNTTTDEIGEWR